MSEQPKPVAEPRSFKLPGRHLRQAGVGVGNCITIILGLALAALPIGTSTIGAGIVAGYIVQFTNANLWAGFVIFLALSIFLGGYVFPSAQKRIDAAVKALLTTHTKASAD